MSHSSSFHSAPDLRGAAAKAREQAKLQAAQFKVEDVAKTEQPRVFSWFGCQASMPRHVACIRKQVLASRPAVRTLTLLLHGLEFCRFPLQAIGGARSVPSGNHSEKALIGCHSITAPLQRALCRSCGIEPSQATSGSITKRLSAHFFVRPPGTALIRIRARLPSLLQQQFFFEVRKTSQTRLSIFCLQSKRGSLNWVKGK